MQLIGVAPAGAAAAGICTGLGAAGGADVPPPQSYGPACFRPLLGAHLGWSVPVTQHRPLQQLRGHPRLHQPDQKSALPAADAR